MKPTDSKFQAAIDAQSPFQIVEGGRQTETLTREQQLADMEAAKLAEQGPYYARRNKKGDYTYQGRAYRSVTTYLGSAVGQHLLLHYGRQAALRSASYLVMGNLAKPSDDRLKEFCDALPQRYLSPEQALLGALDFASNMVEAERYRDHKARIGSLTHHFLYSCAMGHLDPKSARDHEEITSWLWLEAVRLKLFDRDGVAADPSEKQLDDLVNAAYAYVRSASDWLIIAKPTWEMIGQEAMVVRIGATPEDPWFEEYLWQRCGITPKQLWALPQFVLQIVLDYLEMSWAGTVDGHWSLHQGVTGLAWHEAWPEQKVDLWGDFKTSNSLDHKSVQAQVSAYRDCDVIVIVATGEQFPLPKADMIGSLHVGPHAEVLGIKDEFGTLESHTKQIGAKLYTYPESELPLRGFEGIVRWADYAANVPKAHQQPKRGLPKKEPIDKTKPRACPI